MTTEFKEIQILLISNSNLNTIDFINKIVPGTYKSYGVKTPVLNEIARKYKMFSFDLAEELWNSGALEEKIVAIKILEKTGKQDPPRLLKLVKQFAKNIDNWPVCDGLGMQALRSIVKTHRDEIFQLAKKYNTSKDPWQRRLSLVMVEWYTREKNMLAPIKALVKNLESDKEYYVQKAVAWIKRNIIKNK
jgi:3-methyladenine DNA glycosylase AlkD